MVSYKETVEYLIRRASGNNILLISILEEICEIFGYTYIKNNDKNKRKIEIYKEQNKIKTLSVGGRFSFILEQLKSKELSEKDYKEILKRVLNKMGYIISDNENTIITTRFQYKNNIINNPIIEKITLDRKNINLVPKYIKFLIGDYKLQKDLILSMIVENRDIKKLFNPKIIINGEDIDINKIKQINSNDYKYKLVRTKNYWIYLEEKNRNKRYYKLSREGVEEIKMKILSI